MIINGKEMSAKQFAQEYVPTPEEFSTHTMVELYYKLEDIKLFSMSILTAQPSTN